MVGRFFFAIFCKTHLGFIFLARHSWFETYKQTLIMKQSFCNQCNRDCEILEHEGETCCMECGNVIEENRAVETAEFIEVGGSYQVVGTRVGDHGAIYGGGRGSSNRNSSQKTLDKGKNKQTNKQKKHKKIIKSNKIARENIEEVVHNLKMPQSITKVALKLYKLLLAYNFTHGRRIPHVVAATVYATCRMNEPRPCKF